MFYDLLKYDKYIVEDFNMISPRSNPKKLWYTTNT